MSKKYRSIESIFDAISKDYSWRIHELSSVKRFAETAKKDLENMAIRQGVLMLYAHWEGFIKFTATEYLQFVVDCKYKQCDLTDNFRGIMLRKNYKGQSDSHSIKHHISAVKLMLSDDAYVIFNPRDQIKTKSNLSYQLFENILETLAIDKTDYISKKHQIDVSLLACRNKIAHGEYDIPGKQTFLELFDDIVGLISHFKDDIQNLCITEGFKKNRAI